MGFHYGFPKNDRRGAIFSPFCFSLPGLWRYGGRSLRPVWFGLCYLSHRRKLHGMCHGEIFFVGGEYFDTRTSNSSVLWLVLCVFCVLSNEDVKAKNVLHPPPEKIQHFTKKNNRNSPNHQTPGRSGRLCLGLGARDVFGLCRSMFKLYFIWPESLRCSWMQQGLVTGRFVGYNRPGGMTLKKKDGACMANVWIFPKE